MVVVVVVVVRLAGLEGAEPLEPCFSWGHLSAAGLRGDQFALGFLPGAAVRLTCWTGAGRVGCGELLLKCFGLEQPAQIECWVVFPSILLLLRAGDSENSGRPGLDLQ